MPTANEALSIRPATIEDVPIITDMIHQLAVYERLVDECHATGDAVQGTLFGERRYAECVIARWEEEPAGYALFFHNYSTFAAKPGLYLEDLFVLPSHRGRGIGRALLRHLAGIAVARDCARFEWAVLDWNQPAIDFYKAMGAQWMGDWTVMRLSGEALHRLAR